MNIQDLITYSVTKKENAMEVRTDFITPSDSNNSQKRYRFKLDPIGFLSANSMLTGKLTAPAPGNTEPRFNCQNGVLGALERCTLSVGDRILNDTEGVNDWATLNHLYKQDRDTLNGYYTHFLQNQLVTLDDSDDKQILYDNDKSGYDLNAQVPNSFKITDDTDNNYTFAIPLGLVIPALTNKEIPLFLFDQYQIFITFYFSTPDKYITDGSAPSRYPAANENYFFSDLELKVDYKLYPTVMENAIREDTLKAGGYVMNFPDIIKVESVLASGTLGTVQEKEFRLQLQNKEVHTISLIKKYQNGVDSGANSSGNDRDVFWTGRDQYCIGMKKEEYNVRVNGSDLYEEDLKYPNQHFNQVEYTLDKRLEVERPFYYSDKNTWYCGLTLPQINGVYKPLCADLRNGNPGVQGAGTFVGQYPIVWKYKRTPIDDYDNQDLELNFYVTVTRKAVITNDGNKQNVQVSY